MAVRTKCGLCNIYIYNVYISDQQGTLYTHFFLFGLHIIPIIFLTTGKTPAVHNPKLDLGLWHLHCLKKRLTRATLQNNCKESKTLWPPFRSLCLRSDTISCADSKRPPPLLLVLPSTSSKHEGLCIIIYIRAPAETSGWTLTTPAVDVILTPCCSVSRVTTCL